MSKSNKRPRYGVRDEQGNYAVLNEDELIARAFAILERRYNPGKKIDSPTTCVHFVRSQIGEMENEVFIGIFMDTQYRILAVETLGLGTIDSAEVHPREVVKAALRHNAAAVIFAHNHPSGMVTASASDRRLTEQLKQALKMVGTRVLDHIVVGRGNPEHYSFASEGVL